MPWLLRAFALTMLVAMSLPQVAWAWSRAECCAGVPCDDADDEEQGCPPSCDHCMFGPHAPRLMGAPLESIPAPLDGIEVRAVPSPVVTPPDPPPGSVFHPPRGA